MNETNRIDRLTDELREAELRISSALNFSANAIRQYGAIPKFDIQEIDVTTIDSVRRDVVYVVKASAEI